MQFRPSTLPRLDKCPASKKKPTVDIQRSFAAQKQGNAVHEMLSQYYTETGENRLDFSAVIEKEDIENLPELYRNFWTAVKWLESLEGIEIVGVEKRLKSNHWIDFDGTCDILFIFNGRLYVLDWKTGRVERDYKRQLEAYLVLACEELGFKEGTIIEFYTQTAQPYIHNYKEGFIERFYQNLDRIATNNNYDPGAHCEFCPIFYECEARQVMLKHALNVLANLTFSNEKLTDDQLIELYESSNAVANVIENFKEIFKSEIAVKGSIKNEIFEFTINEVKTRSILFDKALPELVALDIPNMQDLKSKLTLGSTIFKEFLKKNVPSNKKSGEFITSTLDHLEAKGAMQIGYHGRTTKKKRKD